MKKNIEVIDDIFDQQLVADEIKRQLLARDLDSIIPQNNLQRCIKAAIEVAQHAVTVTQTKDGYKETINAKCFEVFEALLERSIGRFNPFFVRETVDPQQVLNKLIATGNIEALKLSFSVNDEGLTFEEAEERRKQIMKNLL